MKGLIVAAGSGTRLRPLTFSIPKPLVPIANTPVFLYAVQSFLSNNIKDIGIIINPQNAGEFEHIVKNNEICRSANITFIHQKVPKGIANAIYCAKDYIWHDSFVAQLGDNIIFHDYKSFIKDDTLCRILVAPVDNISKYGIVEFDNEKIVNLVEKPKESKSNMAMVGLYYFNPIIFKYIDKLQPSARGEYEITDAIRDLLLLEGSLEYEICDTWWKDVGTPHDILEANRYILANIKRTKNIVGESTDLIDTKLDSYVSIGNNCNLTNCNISNSIILDNVTLKDIDITDSVIGNNCMIAGSQSSILQISTTLGSNSVISLQK